MKVEQLKNKNGEDFYPVSHEKAVIVGGETLENALARKGTYTKPASGIPATDLTQSVQSSLSKADSALVDPQDGNVGDVLTLTEDGIAWQEPSGTGDVSSVNGQTGEVVLSASDVGALPDSTVIPSAYDDTEIRGLISAKYSKPTAGIPKTDLASAVQTSLGKADTALQSLPTHSHAQTDITGLSNALNAKLTTPSGGTDGQVLTKTASGYAWQTPSGGGECNVPIMQSNTLVDLYNELSDTTNCIGICLGINDYYYSYDGGVDPTQHDAEENPQIVSIYERQTEEVDYIGVVLTASGHIYYWDFRESTPMVMRKLVADEALEGLYTLATQIDEDIGL